MWDGMIGWAMSLFMFAAHGGEPERAALAQRRDLRSMFGPISFSVVGYRDPSVLLQPKAALNLSVFGHPNTRKKILSVIEVKQDVGFTVVVVNQRQ